MKTSRRLWIVEGPDGAGKSTLVRALARETGADVVHHGPYRFVSDGLERLYAESVLPAALGQADVILDRCWLSEPIYGRVFRNGLDRLGVAATRSLERLALRCRTVVVRCLPPLAEVVTNFARRKGARPEAEMLDHVRQVEAVWRGYEGLRTALPVITYDYTIDADMIGRLIDDPGISWDRNARTFTTPPHPVAWASAGRLDAPIALVGDAFDEHRNRDMRYRWPFGSFNGGPSRWLAARLDRAGISERDLFWVNADALDAEVIDWLRARGTRVVALGSTADEVLRARGVAVAARVPHPGSCSRFKAGEPDDYELIPILREMLDGAHDERGVAKDTSDCPF